MRADDQLFEYDREEYKTLDGEKPWKKDAKFYRLKLSALALLKSARTRNEAGSWK